MGNRVAELTDIRLENHVEGRDQEFSYANLCGIIH